MSGPILGIDIGGTKLAVGLATADGTLLAEARQASGAEDGPDRVIGRILELARGVVEEARIGLEEVQRIGIGCGGPLDPSRGVIRNALNMPGWIDIPIVARIEQELGPPAFLDNDANAAALGEHRFGAGRGLDNLVYLTVSTGVGGGVILDGRLYQGENGNAAELGHISVDAAGRACHCGSVGCIETYCSGTSIADRTREVLAADDDPSVLRSGPVEAITAQVVAAAAREGDALAAAIWDGSMQLLGAGIVSIIHAFNPRLVILGGGVTRSGDQLFEPVRRVVDERTMPWLREAVEIVPAALGEMTGILGAVAVALDGPSARGESAAHASARTEETTHA